MESPEEMRNGTIEIENGKFVWETDKSRNMAAKFDSIIESRGHGHGHGGAAGPIAGSVHGHGKKEEKKGGGHGPGKKEEKKDGESKRETMYEMKETSPHGHNAEAPKDVVTLNNINLKVSRL